MKAKREGSNMVVVDLTGSSDRIYGTQTGDAGWYDSGFAWEYTENGSRVEPNNGVIHATCVLGWAGMVGSATAWGF